ncbi:MAG: hypothetical protein ACXVEF_41165 [Polyangiales bacterium]
MRALGLLVLSLFGCSQIVDVDRFHEKAAALPPSTTKSTQFLDLQFSVVGMKPHLAHTFEYRIIDANNLVQSRGIVSPLGAPDVTVFVPRAIPRSNGPYRIDFYGDVNGSGGYDGIGSVISNDHAWRIDPLVDYPAGTVTPVDGLVQVTFTHSTSFTDIDQYPSGTPNKAKDTGLGAKVHVTSLPIGRMIEARVAEKDTKHVVGLMRIPSATAATLDLVIPGVVDVGVDYEVDLYVDANGNGTYDDPQSGDWGIRTGASSTETGLAVTIDAAASPHDTDVGRP